MRVFITGVSSGIGSSLAQEYLQHGETVAGVSRRTPPWSQSGFHFEILDVSETSRVPAAVQRAAEAMQGIDLAVLNAGVLGRICDMKDATLDEMKRTLDINLWANKSLIDALTALPQPPAQIVAISSGASVNGNRGWNGYSISKAALNMLILLYSREHADIHFAALAPGLVDTEMQDILCGLDTEDRFPSLEMLQSRRHTPDMPGADEFAPRLRKIIAALPTLVETGAYVDVRKPPLSEGEFA